MGATIPLTTSLGRNYERAPWTYVMWGVPFVLMTASSVVFSSNLISLTAAGTLWTLSVGWFGVGCLINARACGRVHCRIDGIAFPMLAFIGVLNVLSVVSFDWNIFLGVFLVILVASFVPEFLWKKYS
ncbi:MAG: hypothetical protein OK449_10070 [Thaumarchaeota archaeon]|nr:hypothetical protein [Nitrososphaerota archaeon]